MYVVRNLTKHTIILSDIRAEIGPGKMLDLEKVAHREAIERSADLRAAKKSSRLRLIGNDVASKPKLKPAETSVINQITERIIEKPSENNLDEEKLEAIMRKILSEQIQPSAAVNTDQILDAVIALKKQLATTDKSSPDMPNIDPTQFADLQSKAVEKLSETIETGVKKTPKKVKLKNTKSSDLANELD